MNRQDRGIGTLGRVLPLGSADARALLLLAGLAGVLACAGAPEPTRACLEMEASPNLNLYDGQAHAVTVYLFPLTGTLGFEQASVRDLLEGHSPPGAAGPAVPLTLGPGEQRSFEESLPSSAVYVGLVADYYRGPGDEEGIRRAVVPAKCGFFPPKISLSPRDLLVN